MWLQSICVSSPSEERPSDASVTLYLFPTFCMIKADYSCSAWLSLQLNAPSVTTTGWMVWWPAKSDGDSTLRMCWCSMVVLQLEPIRISCWIHSALAAHHFCSPERFLLDLLFVSLRSKGNLQPTKNSNTDQKCLSFNCEREMLVFV